MLSCDYNGPEWIQRGRGLDHWAGGSPVRRAAVIRARTSLTTKTASVRHLWSPICSSGSGSGRRSWSPTAA